MFKFLFVIRMNCCIYTSSSVGRDVKKTAHVRFSC